MPQMRFTHRQIFGTRLGVGALVAALALPPAHSSAFDSDGPPAELRGFTDCNGNGVDDAEDIANGTSLDCNGNGVPDECDIAGGTSADCNANGMPDECETDCNGNGVPDDCDIASGFSLDCNANGVPDECETDCNGNGVPDDCDIAGGVSGDCNLNGVPDECEVDCNGNGTPDDCDLRFIISGAPQTIVSPVDHPEYRGFGWPDWSPAGDRIVFEGTRAVPSYYVFDLLSATPEGNDFQVVLADPNEYWGYGIPRYSRSGDRLSMHAWQRPLGDWTWKLGISNADGSGMELFNPAGPNYGCASTDWSPDDSTLVISSDHCLNRLAFFDVASAQLTMGPLGSMATWSPDPATPRLVTGGPANSGGQPYMFIINLMGARLLALRGPAAAPAWSPDGRWIAYSSSGWLAVSRSDGSARSNLGIRGRVPRWSPDSANLVYSESYNSDPGQGRICRVALTEVAGASSDCNANGVPDECEANLVPVITEPPGDAAACVGSDVALHVGATGPGTLCYQWRKEGQPLQDNQTISGANTSTLNLHAVAPEDGGTYDVLVLTPCGTAVSPSAVVTIPPPVHPGDCNCDGAVGFSDIDFFVAAIPHNEAAWRSMFTPGAPTCCFDNCDVNGDGNVGFGDIDPFVAIIPSARE